MSGPKQQLRLKQTQALNLTPQLEKSLQILQYNQHDLQLAISDMLASNVMLMPGDDIISTEYLDDTGSISDDNHPDELAAMDEIPGEIDSDVDWQDVYDSESDIPVSSNTEDFYEKSLSTASSDDSFDELLENAIYMAFSNPDDFAIAKTILSSLDENYFLTLSPEQLAKKNSFDLANVLSVIQTIKHLSISPGVASRSIQECLLAQLHCLSNCSEAVIDAHEILENYFAYLGKSTSHIMKRLNLSESAYTAALTVIQKLSPYPNPNNELAANVNIKPDIYVHQRMGIFYASLNKDVRFDIHINQDYADLAKKCRGDEKHFVTSQLQEAKSLIYALEQRNKTILRVANAIVMHQQEYFNNGDAGIQPLSMQEVAELLDLHESTVSRTVNGKYLSFNHKLIELRYFFSQSMSSTDESNNNCISAHAIKAKIKTLIEEEDAQKPLSDSAIEILLNIEGIDISRRTVAKYREQLGFVKSSQRKNKN